MEKIREEDKDWDWGYGGGKEKMGGWKKKDNKNKTGRRNYEEDLRLSLSY